MPIPAPRATMLALATLLGSAVAGQAQADKSWLAVPGWIHPDSAARHPNTPFFANVFDQSGFPVSTTLLTGAEMAGIDLVIRGAFRYHDSRDAAHGRSWLVSLSGVAVATAASAILKNMAPSAARRANAERIAEAEARARELAASTTKPLPGLAIGDTVNVRSLNGSTRSGFVVSATLPSDQLTFREDGSVRTRADSTQPLRLASIRRHVRAANPVPMLLGFVGGLGGAVVVCAKAFEGCFPYTTMFATSTAGYALGRLMPITIARSITTTAVRRE